MKTKSSLLPLQQLLLLLPASLPSATLAFAPPRTRATISASALSYLNDCTSLEHSHTSSSSQPTLLETLDAEMDTFASPNDRRYSASDWFHNILNFHNSSILNQIRQPVGVISLWSVLVSLFYKYSLGRGWDVERMVLGSTPHSFIAGTVGLLLVFRTNSAYQRFRVSNIIICCC
jgi:hypothetical protein